MFGKYCTLILLPVVIMAGGCPCPQKKGEATISPCQHAKPEKKSEAKPEKVERIVRGTEAHPCDGCSRRHENVQACKCSCHQAKLQTANQFYLDKMDETKDRTRCQFVDMVDNEILQDMSVADIHFVPHTTELSGTGKARLDRMAPLLAAYGGTVRYETYAKDELFVAQRVAHVREYLGLTLSNMERVQVKPMISGGRLMPAGEALDIMMRGTAKASAAQPSATMTGTPSGAQAPN